MCQDVPCYEVTSTLDALAQGCAIFEAKDHTYSVKEFTTIQEVYHITNWYLFGLPPENKFY